jgi:hypothetical protein
MALSRFISCLGEQGLPLFRLLKKTDRFVWTDEAQEALGKLKQVLTKALILVPLVERELLLLYIVVTMQVISVSLVVEQEETGHAFKVQRPSHFISEVLTDSKTHYLQIQKLLYAILIARRKLEHNFETHPQ